MATPRSVAALGGGIALLLTTVIAAEAVGGMSGTVGEFFAASWGRVTLTDLYLGLLLVALWMWRRESRLLVRLSWILAFAGLGNIAVGIYLIRAGWGSTWDEFFNGPDQAP